MANDKWLTPLPFSGNLLQNYSLDFSGRNADADLLTDVVKTSVALMLYSAMFTVRENSSENSRKCTKSDVMKRTENDGNKTENDGNKTKKDGKMKTFGKSLYSDDCYESKGAGAKSTFNVKRWKKHLGIEYGTREEYEKHFRGVKS